MIWKIRFSEDKLCFSEHNEIENINLTQTMTLIHDGANIFNLHVI